MTMSDKQSSTVTQRLFSEGKVTIPSHIREEYSLEDGDLVELDIRPVGCGGD
jgi:bifunctional DNA-binding transcriptional regulator/antitoxin component of YhaV-PrlF toxin-antitoxin module